MHDGGCLPEDAVGVLHKSCPTTADSCVPEGATGPTCCNVHEAGRIMLPSDLADCVARNGELCASVAAAISRLLDSVGWGAPDLGATTAAAPDAGVTIERGETVNPVMRSADSAGASVSAKQTDRDAAMLS